MSPNTEQQNAKSETKFAPRLLVQSSCKSVIHSPLKNIDIGEWLFTLSDAEYQQCSISHIACGSSRNADGKLMSLNVEEIGGSIVVEHYVEDILERQRCRVVSTSDVLVQGGRTTAHVVWELSVTPLTESSCEFTNFVLVHTTDSYETFIEHNGVTYEQAKAAMESAVGAHNAEETPLFAKSIERKALLLTGR
jgi:hypothetical protein